MPTYDIIGITSHGLFWTMVETNVALIACCLPTLRPILSMAAFGTAIASLGSFLQGLGSALGSTRTRTQNSSASHSTGKFSKLSISSGSVWQSQNSKAGIAEISRRASDVSLVEMGKADAVRVTRVMRATREKTKTPDPYDVHDMEMRHDLEHARHGKNESRCDAV
jgi:hypothetical protein